MACQYLALVLWIGGAAVVDLAADLVTLMAVGLVSLFGLVFLFDPRRRWWSDDVRQLAADPAQVRRYLVRMTVTLLVVAVVVPLVIGYVAAAAGIAE